MGRVYQAVHETMERVVALKILAPQMLDTERAQAMFLREIRAAAKLNHPNIVMAFDANEVDGRHLLAMEYVDGPNLEEYVQGHGALPAGLACEIIFQAASGLQHAHENGIVHRDIMPANLLVKQEPGSRTIQVKILDFGLARLRFAGATAVNTKSSEEHAVMGTPDYLAPEQIKDLHGADMRAGHFFQRAPDGFLNPILGVGAKPGVLGRIETLDRMDQPEIALLDEIGQARAAADNRRAIATTRRRFARTICSRASRSPS
jgi:serine/threonine protein kinase